MNIAATQCTLFGIAIIASVSFDGVAAEPAMALTIDPFDKPPLEIIELPVPDADNAADEVEQSVVETLPRLRAILHAKERTLVNLDGDLVSLGASYRGYHVAAVGERDVVLSANGKPHVVSLDKQESSHAQ